MICADWILEEADRLELEFGTWALNPYQVIQHSEIDLIECDLGDKTLGQTIRNCRCHAILLNERLDKITKEFVLWHEIAHVRLHKGISTAEFRRDNLTGLIMGIEAEANILALEMMKRTIPHYELEDMDNYNIIEYLGLPHELDHLVI